MIANEYLIVSPVLLYGLLFWWTLGSVLVVAFVLPPAMLWYVMQCSLLPLRAMTHLWSVGGTPVIFRCYLSCCWVNCFPKKKISEARHGLPQRERHYIKTLSRKSCFALSGSTKWGTKSRPRNTSLAIARLYLLPSTLLQCNDMQWLRMIPAYSCKLQLKIQ